MAKNFIQEGDVLQYANASGSTIVSGQAFLMGAMLAIAVVDIANNASGSVSVEGVWLLTKATGASTGGAIGTKAYWDDTAKKITAVATSNTHIGYFAATAADGDATAQVKLGV